MSTNSDRKIAIAAIFKDEAHYILEWIAWHRIIGFQKFIVADNESTDSTREILLCLEKVGIVEYLLFLSGNLRSPQLAAYEQILSRRAAGFEWVAFIDADEFIFPTSAEFELASRLRAVPDDVGAIVLNWACFGSSGQDRFENRPVVERFNWRARPDLPIDLNSHYKSIVRPKAVIPDIRNPHHFRLEEGFRHARLNGSTPEFTNPNGGETTEVDWTEWRINHYITKSWSEFYRRKMPKGRSDRADLAHTVGYFFQQDINDIYDPFPAHLQYKLSKEIDELETLITNSNPNLKSVFEGFQCADAPPRRFFDWSKHGPKDIKAGLSWRKRSIAETISRIRVYLWSKFPILRL
jgi:glycosyltransferase involved in cell wall biosynthesis